MWFLMIIWFINWSILSYNLSLDFSFCNTIWFTIIWILIGYFLVMRWAHKKYDIFGFMRG